jgi:cytoskeletal protein RodZ
MSEALKNVGKLLKQRREEKNLSIREVENMTSIRSNYIQSIENGDSKQLISPVYAEGFVKQYAILLGLDGERIIKDNPNLFSKPEKQNFSYGIGTLEVRATGSGGVKWFPNALWIGMTVVFVVLTWLLIKQLNIL